MSAGPNSPIETVLADYDLSAETVVDDVFRSDTDRLLLALLLERRGGDSVSELAVENRAGESRDATAEPSYRSETIEATAEPEEIDLGFNASTLSMRGFTAPVFVAFVDPTNDSDRIVLNPDDGDEPYVISPGSGFAFGQVFVGRAGGSDTTLTVEMFE